MASYVPNQGNPQMTQSSVVVNLNLDRRYLQVVQVRFFYNFLQHMKAC